jgi:hypothetical protein
MKKNFVSFIFFFILFGAIPISCDILCLDSCGCGDNFPPKDYSIKGLEINDFILNQTFNPDFFYPKEELFKFIEVSEFEFLSYSDQVNTSKGFIPMANACSPPPNKSSESISVILISAKNHIGVSSEQNIEIGTDISEYFLITDYPTSSGVSISAYLEDKPKLYLGEGLFLKWNSTLMENSELVFDIQVNLNNGKSFIFENEKMMLLK